MGPCESGGRQRTRGDRCGHCGDNREPVQRHDSDLQPTRTTGLMKGAATHGTGDVSTN